MRLYMLIWAVVAAGSVAVFGVPERLNRWPTSPIPPGQKNTDPVGSSAQTTATDPMQAATIMARSLEEFQQRMIKTDEELFAKLDLLITHVPTGSTVTSTLTLDSVMDPAKGPGGLGTEVLELAHQQITVIQKYMELSTEASNQFRKVADGNREFSRKEQYKEHRQSYLELAVLWDGLADSAEDNSLTIPPILRRMKESLKYVKATQLFLGRLVQQSDSLRKLGAISDERQHLVLSHCMESFMLFRAALCTFHDRIAGSALPDIDRQSPAESAISNDQVTSQP